jgi:aspartate carbamoyltransferase regulatory subunit
VVRRDFRLMLPMLEAHAQPAAKVFHPLPIFSPYPEIDPAIDDSSFAAYFQQAGNGVPTRLALLRLLTDDSFEDFHGEEWEPPAFLDQDGIGIERTVSDDAPPSADLSIRPIRERGVAIDHLPPGLEQEVLQILNIRPGEVYRVGTVRSHKDPSRVKGLVLIENQEVTETQMRLIQAAVGWQSSPRSPVTVNFIEDGKVVRKIDLVMPSVIESSGVCPNIVRHKDGSPKGGCISRPEFYQHVTPRFIHEGAGKFRCYYCDHVADSRVIFR